MESKKDIYNLWLQYTTKNEEIYFRQFISGFVQIWEEQLKINFDNPPRWQTVKTDLGPHLSRLPEELLPAIGKFLIISKDNYLKNENLTANALNDTTLLVKCLTVMSRHFDNIASIANYEYISSTIAIAVSIIQHIFKVNSKPLLEETLYIKAFCELIEVIYDPYFTWRNFCIGNYGNYKHTGYSSIQLHVELVPFIYDCFQCDNILYLPEIGTHLVHMLGSFVSGSQQNGLKAICPATISVLFEILSKWECNSTIRLTILKCVAMMAIVLQRSSPEERQIELANLCQMYVDVLNTLLKTVHFLPKRTEEKFEISSNENDMCIDVNALILTIDNIEVFMAEPLSKLYLCDCFIEAGAMETLSNIPVALKSWDIDLQSIAICIVRCIYFLSITSASIVNILKSSKNLEVMFNGIKSLGKPTQKLLNMCVLLAYDNTNQEIVFPTVIVCLFEWITEMPEHEQLFLCTLIAKICCQNMYCKHILTQAKIIRTICKTLQSPNCYCSAQLFKIIEELGKFSISPLELQALFQLLQNSKQSQYRKPLLQCIASISLHSVSNGTVCNEFLDIQKITDGITVPDIRRWTMSGSYGFIFHAWIRLDDINKSVERESPRNDELDENIRRMIFNLGTGQGTGYEIFIDRNGSLVVAILTKKEYLTTSVSSSVLSDKRWHLITVGIIPPKRAFSHTQIMIYIDGSQKLEATLKFGASTDPLLYCTIGSVHELVPQTAKSTFDKSKTMATTSYTSSTSSSKGMLPSLMEKTFIPHIVSQVPRYFTLPLRNASSGDPNIKCYPIGMQDSVFGVPTCLKGQIGSVLLAEPSTNIKTLLDAGANFLSLISQYTEPYDLTTKFVFCYSPNACHDGFCPDLCPGEKYNAQVSAKYCKTVKIQDGINSIGGISSLFPILDIIVESEDNQQILFESSTLLSSDLVASPTKDEQDDWVTVASTSFNEWKMIQHPLACFICLIRYFTNGYELNEEQLLKSDGVAIMCSLLTKCSSNILDVNVLIAIHMLVESVQSQIPTANIELLERWYAELIFNFKIWSKAHFQITIGHIQYIGTMIKTDRKYFRQNYGIQFCFDTIKQYYVKAENLSENAAKSIRLALLEIVKYYIQKDLNIKEVGVIISYIASLRSEHLITELLEMLISCMHSKQCKDQVFLLLHEPQTAELLYALLTDKNYGNNLRSVVVKFMGCLLYTNRVSRKHKLSLRLHDSTVNCQSLYPGLISHIIPFDLDRSTILAIMDHLLFDDSEFGYCGALHLIYNLHLSDLDLKLEIARKLLSTTFNKTSSSYIIAKQVGWQESIARLLIKDQILSSETEGKLKIGKDIDNDIFDTNSDQYNASDLMCFDDNAMELTVQDNVKEHTMTLTELQASVTEAANVIEHEIKEIAESVTGNISSVYSIIRQKTSDIQDTFESLAMTSTDSKLSPFKTLSTQSSNSTSEENVSSNKSDLHLSRDVQSDSSSMGRPLSRISSSSVDDHEEQLTYLVTNILFTVLWRGIDNNGGDSWKERGQVIACINLLGLNNNLYCSHLTLRLRILEMGIQACLIDLAEIGTQNLHHQKNAAQLLRMTYDLVVLDPNEDENKKCSTKLLDGVLALLDALMVFQQTNVDDWTEMIQLCLGLLLKCSHHPNSEIVAMATAKLHGLLHYRNSPDPQELGYLIYSINTALDSAVEVGNSDQYSFLIPVLKALLDKSRVLLNLEQYVPDLPPTSSGPSFFQNFEIYGGGKQWTVFIQKRIKPLHDAYQSHVATSLWEPLNTFWAECYEACKIASQNRNKQIMESRRRFQQKILLSWRLLQAEEMVRLNTIASISKHKENHVKRRWEIIRRFLYGLRGAWYQGQPEEMFYQLSRHENVFRMRFKLEPSLYHDSHTAAANLRDNTSSSSEMRQLSTEFGCPIAPSAIRDILTEDEVILLEEEKEEKRIQAEQQQQEPHEKVVISQECYLITLMSKMKGRLEVTSKLFSFIDLNPLKNDNENNDFRFPMSHIKEMHLRKYNLRRSALEIFLIDQTSYFLNFTTKTRNKIFSKILSLQPPNILYGSGRSPSELLKSSGLTQKWVNREISNFEYLMQLNTIAGRSYNDLSQYPVFPWILSDYSSEILDLTNRESFRDLSKPIGVVNSKNEFEVRSKYENFEDTAGGIPKFHYGTHYSNSAGVLHYLMRVEPFTSLHIELQSGRFDVADRQFHSIAQTFKLLMDNPNDVKELIPEFFYFPEFLKNMNKFDLGVLQATKERVNDVILPPWANSAEDFIAIHRRALESEYVSQNLNNWIDLIFGYKQKGPKAVEALNVFYYCSYEGAVDLDKITNPIEQEAVEGMINNFGQTPSQLLREPHPKRLTHEEVLLKLLKSELKKPDITAFLDRVVSVNYELSKDKDPIIFLSTPRSPPRSFLQVNPDIIVSISKSGILGSNYWVSQDKDKGVLLEIDTTTTNLRNRKQLDGPFHPGIQLHSQLFAISVDGRYVYAGGIWDNSLKVYNVSKGKSVAAITRHLDVITCIALDSCGSYIVTGSKDCTCIIWTLSTTSLSTSISSYQHQSTSNHSFIPKPMHTLYGHESTVSCVAIMTELDIVVSGSYDGTVNVYTINEGQFVQTLRPLGCTGFTIEITFISLSYQGDIVFSALDDTSHSVHVFNVNGAHLGSKYVSARVTGLTTASDYLVVTDDAGDVTMSRLHGLKPVFDIPLHIPIQTVVVTPGNTHLLAPLRDGKLAVIGIWTPTANKKQSILNV